MEMKIQAEIEVAVIWDFDGVMYDTIPINQIVTQKIFERLGVELNETLQIFSKYRKAIKEAPHWKDCYIKEFKLPRGRIDEAGVLWTSIHQEISETNPPKVFSGIPKIIEDFEKQGIPQSICSHNTYDNIEKNLTRDKLCPPF